MNNLDDIDRFEFVSTTTTSKTSDKISKKSRTIKNFVSCRGKKTFIYFVFASSQFVSFFITSNQFIAELKSAKFFLRKIAEEKIDPRLFVVFSEIRYRKVEVCKLFAQIYFSEDKH